MADHVARRSGLTREAGLVPVAFGYFTRLPWPRAAVPSQEALDQAIRYLPLVGIVIGGLMALAFEVGARLWPLPVVAALVIGLGVLMTGGLHEDGLADFCDAFFTQRDRDGLFAIMKDPRLGTYGVLGLALTLLLRFALLLALAPARIAGALVAAHAFSRLVTLVAMRALPYARSSDAAPKPASTPLGSGGAMIAGLCGFAPLALVGRPAASAALAAVGTGVVIALLCQRRIGGYTGDCLGAIQQVSELAFYLGLLAWR